MMQWTIWTSCGCEPRSRTTTSRGLTVLPLLRRTRGAGVVPIALTRANIAIAAEQQQQQQREEQEPP